MPTLDDLAQSNQMMIEEAIQKARLAKSNDQKVNVILHAIDEINSKLSDVSITSMPDKVTVKNLDEVRLSLRKELSKAMEPLTKELKRLNLTSEQMEKIRFESEHKITQGFEDNFETFIIKKSKRQVSIDNFQDIVFPEEVKVNNLMELQELFNSLAKTIKDTFNIDIPVPQVNVQAPQVNIPETVVNVPPVDLRPLLNALSPLKFISDLPNKAVSVRMSNGRKFIDLLKKLSDNQERQVQAFTGSQGVTKKDISRILGTPVLTGSGVKSLTSATVAVLLNASSIKIRHVDISAVKQPIAVGDSTAAVDLSTSANSSGSIIYPGSNPLRVQTTNINQIYVAGPTGSAASYTYYI